MMKTKRATKIFILLIVILFGYRYFNNHTNNNQSYEANESISYRFRNSELLKDHYNKHGIEMGFDSPLEYETAASNVVNNPNALHKLEKEDNDHVYFLEETNEIVFLSNDGYIRTYFISDSGKSYFDKQ